MGVSGRCGRLTRASSLAETYSVLLAAEDGFDVANQELLEKQGVTNLKSAHCTREEVRSALEYSNSGRVMFGTSLEHLSRVVRDAMSMGGTLALFAASNIAFSPGGPISVKFIDFLE